MAVAKVSDQPSPIPRASLALRQRELAGPPVRRLDRPWQYSWITTPASMELSRLMGDMSQVYMCMRPLSPSGGVAKLALLVPERSWLLTMAISLPAPPWLLLLVS